MSTIDRTLYHYFQYARLYHETNEPDWLKLLSGLKRDGPPVVQRAVLRLETRAARQEQERSSVDSS